MTIEATLDAILAEVKALGDHVLTPLSKIREAAKVTRLSPQQIRNGIASGKYKCWRDGHAMRVSVKQILEVMEREGRVTRRHLKVAP